MKRLRYCSQPSTSPVSRGPLSQLFFFFFRDERVTDIKNTTKEREREREAGAASAAGVAGVAAVPAGIRRSDSTTDTDTRGRHL